MSCSMSQYSASSRSGKNSEICDLNLEAKRGNSNTFRGNFGCLDLPKRPELPERPPKYRKDQRIIGN